MQARSLLVLLGMLGLVAAIGGCSQTGSVDGDAGSTQNSVATGHVRYRDRDIDLAPFLNGYPYYGLEIDVEHGHMLYFEKRADGTRLRYLPLPDSGPIDLSRGRALTDIDWSTRSWWGAKYHAKSDRFYVMSDESNDEKMNLYSIDRTSGALRRETHNDYTYGWGFSDDGRYLGYLARSGVREPFTTSLIVRDLVRGEERTIIDDAKTGGADGRRDRFTWSDVRFTPDDQSVIVQVQHDGDRALGNIARIALSVAQPQFELLLEARVKRYSVSILDGWLEPGVSFLYQSGESGFANAYAYDLTAHTSRQLTHVDESVKSAALLDTKAKTLLMVTGGLAFSTFFVVDPLSGESSHTVQIEGNCEVLARGSDRAYFTRTNQQTPFQVGLARVVETPSVAIAFSEFATIPKELLDRIATVRAERVRYPTFDDRELDAYLLEPKQPPKRPQDRRIIITAFYGGSNSYSTQTNILAAAGIATFSPAVRGSWGYGSAFAALNDGDLGGDEIVDIIYAARWLVENRGYTPQQIGVAGGSHGGYATLRCLTFPSETNGRDAHFDFAFGWSHAGFSDISSFYEKCNIPDWVLLEAGNPATEADKLRDRSPLYHVDLLHAPVLLTHGSNDWRVPVTESRQFVARARELGRRVEYIEFPGQGHHISGFENQVEYYRGVLKFFEGLPSSGPAAALH